MNKIKAAFGIIGCVITLVGWMITHHEQFPLIERTFAPDYYLAVKQFRQMQINGHEITNKDTGFYQIADVVKKGMTSKSGHIPVITKIKTLSSNYLIGNRGLGMDAKPYMFLEIYFDKTKPISGPFEDLHALIAERYLKIPFLSWGAWIFWIGLLISIIPHAMTLFFNDGK